MIFQSVCSAVALHGLSLSLLRFDAYCPFIDVPVLEAGYRYEVVNSVASGVDFDGQYLSTHGGLIDNMLLQASGGLDDTMLLQANEVVVEKRNILTNKLLEGIRIANQADYDNKYSDAAVDQAVKADDNSKLVLLLIPIINIKNDLQMISDLISQPSYASLSKAHIVLDSSSYDTKQLKKIFNRYADNIYYSDPDRANLYLGGGAVPDTKQTEKYLLRNEVITNINNLHDDIDILLEAAHQRGGSSSSSKEKEGSTGRDLDAADQDYIDTVDDCRTALDSIQQYLSLVDKDDLELATRLTSKL